jgi:hypothetical protein
MNKEFVDLAALPVRFNPPDEWRTPHPLFISLYQASDFASDWKPYPDAPPIPASWPWWEENGTSWYRFFRDRAPLPARSLGNWFSLAALGLFGVVVSPFVFEGMSIVFGGASGVVLIFLGIRGVIRTTKSQNQPPSDPYDSVREWAAERRGIYFHDAYQRHRQNSDREISFEQFVREQVASWWGENPAGEEN